MVGCLPMSFNFDFSEEELSGVLKSGLLGLSGLVDPDSGFTPASVTVEGGVSLDSLGVSYWWCQGWVRRKVLL